MEKQRLIVVDDDAVCRQLVFNCFRGDRSTEVVTCESAAEVLTKLQSGQKVDCLLIDWNMPVMNGYELVCAVRADSRFRNVRIVMLTSETSMPHVQQALAAGADEYLMKPFTKQMLIEKISLLEFR